MAFYTCMISAGLLLSTISLGVFEKAPNQAAITPLSSESAYENFQLHQGDVDLLTDLVSQSSQPNQVSHRGSGRSCPLTDCE